MSLIHVKPTEGSRVRLPSPRAKELLPEAGLVVEDSSFWRRREADQEVEISEAPQEPPASKPTPAPKPASREA